MNSNLAGAVKMPGRLVPKLARSALTAFAAAAVSLLSGAARADASCTALVQEIVSQLQQNGGFYQVEMTMHRTDVSLVTYSSGTVDLTGYASWPLNGSANQLFSDRLAGNQPFNFNAADQLTPWISATGSLYIYYDTWNFSTNWDMSCTGNTMTRIIPGFGVVSLSFRGWVAPIG